MLLKWLIGEYVVEDPPRRSKLRLNDLQHHPVLKGHGVAWEGRRRLKAGPLSFEVCLDLGEWKMKG